jgi:hypothetical protein
MAVEFGGLRTGALLLLEGLVLFVELLGLLLCGLCFPSVWLVTGVGEGIGAWFCVVRTLRGLALPPVGMELTKDLQGLGGVRNEGTGGLAVSALTTHFVIFGSKRFKVCVLVFGREMHVVLVEMSKSRALRDVRGKRPREDRGRQGPDQPRYLGGAPEKPRDVR